jgi:hypothetical protein
MTGARTGRNTERDARNRSWQRRGWRFYGQNMGQGDAVYLIEWLRCRAFPAPRPAVPATAALGSASG